MPYGFKPGRVGGIPQGLDLFDRKGRRTSLAADALAPGRFRMWRAGYTFSKDPLRLFCLLGDGPVRPVRGFGGWGSLAREGRAAVEVFTGKDTPAIEVPLLIENVYTPSDLDVDGKIRNAERLAGLDLDGPYDTPGPQVRWQANYPWDYAAFPELEWRVEDLSWDASDSDDVGNERWRTATLTLGLDTHAKVTGPGAKKSAGFERHTLRKGKTLRDFAGAFLGDRSRWNDVADLNRDNPRCPKTPGYEVTRDVLLLTPPREPKRRGRS